MMLLALLLDRSILYCAAWFPALWSFALPAVIDLTLLLCVHPLSPACYDSLYLFATHCSTMLRFQPDHPMPEPVDVSASQNYLSGHSFGILFTDLLRILQPCQLS